MAEHRWHLEGRGQAVDPVKRWPRHPVHGWLTTAYLNDIETRLEQATALWSEAYELLKPGVFDNPDALIEDLESSGEIERIDAWLEIARDALASLKGPEA